MKKYIKRDIEAAIKKIVREFPAVILTGPRQSGKTTLLKHLFSRSYRYVSLDDPDARILANDDPRLFLANHPPPVIIDEIQNAPSLLPLIKLHIDEHRHKKGLFLLTGSQHFSLMSNISESLAGRIAMLHLLSLSFKERYIHTGRPKTNLFTIQGKSSAPINIEKLKYNVLRGGFPELIDDKKRDSEIWFSSYLQTYVERDVRQIRQIGSLADFQRFMYLCASLNGQVINLSDISKRLGIAVNTVKEWLSILESSNQIMLLRPFHTNKGKRLIKSPKLYFFDTGLLCYLNGLTTTQQIFKGFGSGALFETIVLGEIVRHYYNRAKIPRCYFWRTSYGEEVDFIIEEGTKLIPIEVKMSSLARKEITYSVDSFIKLFSIDVEQGYIINLGTSLINFKNITILPFNKLIGVR